MKNVILLVLFIFAKNTYAQQINQNCHCPNDRLYDYQDKPDTVFHFSNGHAIMLCGYRNRDTIPNTFSEFILSVCGSDSIINFWGALLNCAVKIKKDTLYVEQIEYLPTGKDLKFKYEIWLLDKIYFTRNKLVRETKINKGIPRYDNKEIEIALKEFETSNVEIDDNTENIECKLFIATISGSVKARKYFNEFRSKFSGCDGECWEYYNSLKSMLALWDDKK